MLSDNLTDYFCLSCFLSSIIWWCQDLLILVCHMFGGQLILHTSLGSEDGLGPFWPECWRKYLFEGGDSLPTQGIFTTITPSVFGHWAPYFSLLMQQLFLCSCFHGLCVSVGLLLQCHCGGCTIKIFMDFNHLPQHNHQFSWHLWHTGNCTGPDGGL